MRMPRILSLLTGGVVLFAAVATNAQAPAPPPTYGPPISLAQAGETRLREGDHVGLLGIGSGLNCSLMSVTW